MARRWLLTLLTGIALSIGLAGSASAQELGDPLVLDAEVASVTVDADPDAQRLEAELTTDAASPETDTAVQPQVSAEVTPDGPAVDTDGTVEVLGTDVPLAEADEPVGPAPAPAPADGSSQGAAGSGISPAPRPAAAGPSADAAERRTVQHSNTMSADSAAVRSGLRAQTAVFDSVGSADLAPLVAPPAVTDEPALVAAAAPPAAADLALPIIDPTPTVPGVLRLLAGLLVLGAAVTWRTVRDELA